MYPDLKSSTLSAAHPALAPMAVCFTGEAYYVKFGVDKPAYGNHHDPQIPPDRRAVIGLAGASPRPVPASDHLTTVSYATVQCAASVFLPRRNVRVPGFVIKSLGLSQSKLVTNFVTSL